MKARKSSTILIVDDDLNDQQLILRSFRKMNIPNHLCCVNSGNEAIDYLNGRDQFGDRKQFPYPTYILTDLKMQNGDGFSLLFNLKSNPEWAVIPTIVLTGSHDLDDIKKSFILGASAYFVKPNTLEGFDRIAKVTYDFWSLSETPEVDETGQQLPTKGEGKLGERFEAPEYVRRERSPEEKS